MCKGVQRKVLSLILFFLLINISFLYAFDNDDFQFWYTQNEEFRISEDFKLNLEEELRFGDNANHLYYHHHDLGFLFNLKNQNLGFGYRHIYEEKRNKFKIENEPYIIYGYKFKRAIFDFGHRLRLEYRHFDYQADSWRLRSKLDIILPIKFYSFKFQTYLAEEIFLNFYNRAFSQNRLFFGVSKDLSANLKLDLYYLLQHTKSSLAKWNRINALGAKIKLVF
jgi:hypothetical protein